ncbi:class I heat shock protein, partial [Trifolium pratense]
MSLIPSFFGGRRSNVFDPFSLDVFDPFKDFPLSNSLTASFPELSRENSAFVSTRVDWKETPEAHVFKADLPGLKKEEVKV